MQSKPVSVAIIITTHNRCKHLQQTLSAFASLQTPGDWQVSLYVIDNASTDATAGVVAEAQLPRINIRYLYEPKPGKTHAQNTALKATETADILLWTDDDIRPPSDWIEVMCRPIVEGKGDCVYGQIRMAKHLERFWMEPTHYQRLADTRFQSSDWDVLIGANMAFHRRVVERIPVFDTELGPGRLGFADDTLYSLQAAEAGFVCVGSSSTVEHHFDPSRLLRRAWLKNANGNGRSDAYLWHHWHHLSVRAPKVKLMRQKLRLSLHRFIARSCSEDAEGCDPKEIDLVEKLAFVEQYLIERKKPRKYDLHGLRPLKNEFEFF